MKAMMKDGKLSEQAACLISLGIKMFHWGKESFDGVVLLL
jgi:hypothetical protein